MMFNKIYNLLSVLLAGISFVLGYLYHSMFDIFYAVNILLFLVIQYRMNSVIDEDEKRPRKPANFFLLLPPVITISTGILFLISPVLFTEKHSYLMLASSVILLACLTFRIITLWRDTSLTGRLLRLTIAATMTAPLSLGISLTLYLTTPDEAAVLSCMTTIIFGMLALLIMGNIIMISHCEYKGTRESIRIILKTIRERKLVFTRVSILKDIFLVIGKGGISFISVSLFMFINALYSAGMGVARFIALRMHTQEKKQQITSYRHVGMIIFISSICYVLYSTRLFFGGKTSDYDMYIALSIALYTFVEFGINIREAIRLRKSNALEAKALRAISFSSTLICFVLTQTSIMSFANENDNSFSNALSGLVFGGLAALVGIYIILDSISNKKKLEQQETV